MTRDPRRLPDYLGHILQAIERIRRYTDHTDEAAFLQGEMLQDAVIRNLEVIGEASRNIEHSHPDFVAAHPELPLAFAYEMRNASRMATSRWIWSSCGRPLSATYPRCSGGYRH